MKSKYLLLIIYVFTLSIGRCETYRIRFTSDVYPITIELRRYENSFIIEPVEIIELKQAYEFSRDIDEYDSYAISIDGARRSGLYFFMWDGDVHININSKAIYNSTIKNSPLTTEYYHFKASVEKAVFKEIRDLDALLLDMDKKGIKASDPFYKDTKLKRNELLDQGPKKYESFVRNYFKNNPQSYISVYVFGEIGILPDENELSLLKNMPNRLQKNHRYIRLISP